MRPDPDKEEKTEDVLSEFGKLDAMCLSSGSEIRAPEASSFDN